MAVFTFIFAVFLSLAAKIQILPVLKTDGHDVGILLPVSIWPCDTPAYQVLSGLHDWRQSNDVISMFQDSGCSVVNLFQFRFVNDSRLRRSEAISVPNFDKISLSVAEVLPYSVSENKRPPY